MVSVRIRVGLGCPSRRTGPGRMPAVPQPTGNTGCPYCIHILWDKAASLFITTACNAAVLRHIAIKILTRRKQDHDFVNNLVMTCSYISAIDVSCVQR